MIQKSTGNRNKTTVRNPLYLKAFAMFFKRLMDFFSEIREEDLTKEYDNVLMFDAAGNPYPNIVQTINFHQLVENYIQTLQDWPEYKILKKNLMLVDAAGREIKDKNDFHFHHNYIPSIAHRLYEESEGRLHCNNKTVKAQYALIENAIYESEWIFSVKAPLNINLETDRMKLDDKLVINRISRKDLNSLFKMSLVVHGDFPFGYSHSIKTILSMEVSKEKGETHRVPPLGSRELFTKVAASLSIFKRAPINFGLIYVMPKNFWTIFGGGIHFSGLRCQTAIDTVIIEKREIRAYRAFWKKLKDSSNSNAWLRLACERLVEYHNKLAPSDKIIDLIIIFEILYLPEGGSELKFRLAANCSKVLSGKKETRENIFDRLKLAYDIRSNLVHTGEISKNSIKKLKSLGINLIDLIKSLETYLYDSFNVFVKKPETRDNLDSILLT